MWYAFSFFAGVAALLAAPSLPPAWVALPVAIAALTTGALSRRLPWAALACGACCGLLYAGYCARDYLAHRWPESLSDERVIAAVVVDSIPAQLGSGWSFDGLIRIEAPASAQAGWGDELRVRIVSRDSSFRPRAGERWRLLLALRTPRGRSNPAGQDFERNQFRDGIHALGTVLAASVNRRIDGDHRPLDQLRERISQHIDAHVTDRDASALIAALAVGDTGRISREQWRVFNATGTTHLVAISGMHVTLFAVIAFALARKFWGGCVWLAFRFPRSVFGKAAAWSSSWPRETFASVLGFAAAMAYATLAGLSVPTQRTLIMLGVWLLALSMARASHPFQPFAIALLAVLVFDPFAPLSAGFWLSFAAMAAIIFTTTGRFARRPVWVEALTVQAVVTVALLPFSLALFGSVSLIGPPVNLLAIPAMSWVLVPTVLLSVALMPVSAVASNAVLSVAAWMHDHAWPWLAAASDVPWALLHASPPWWWYGLAIVALAFASLPWPLSMRVAALICIVPMAASIEHPLKVGEAEVTVLDVGEGSAVVVRTAGHVLVFGTGDSFGTDGRMAETVVAPYLRSFGARAIDCLVLSRVSPAIGEGVTALWAQMPIRQTLVGAAADRWVWEGIRFEFRGSDASDAGGLSMKTDRQEVRIRDEVTAILDSGRARWLVVSGRRAQRSAAKVALPGGELQGAQVLTTADLGAIRIRIATGGPVGASDPAWMAPEAQRAHGRRLWTASP